uniref:Uncharacterized protein n=1 Tax=Ananas comosus var. bracteatus TaxID=296719 RepID=A0A6V7Q5S6_ANACO|nr:unnamed protein product [Ananas comosus var. bracteatus]
MFARAVLRSLRGRVGQTHSKSRDVGLPQALRRHKLDYPWIGPQLKLGGGVDAVEKFMCCELKRKLWKLSISCGTLKLSLVNWAAELEKVPAVAVAEQEAWAIRIERKSEICQEVISEDNGAELFGACSIKGDQLRKLWVFRKLWKLSISCGTLKLSLVNWAAELEKVPAVAVAEQEAWAIRIERKSEIW